MAHEGCHHQNPLRSNFLRPCERTQHHQRLSAQFPAVSPTRNRIGSTAAYCDSCCSFQHRISNTRFNHQRKCAVNREFQPKRNGPGADFLKEGRECVGSASSTTNTRRHFVHKRDSSSCVFTATHYHNNDAVHQFTNQSSASCFTRHTSPLSTTNSSLFVKLLFIYLFIIALQMSTTIFSSSSDHFGMVLAQSPAQTSDSIIRYKGRRWYAAGKFTRLYNDMDQLDEPLLKIENPIDQQFVNATNVGYFDGRKFYPMNNGTNGEVFELQIDSCLNVFVGGSFTHVSNGNGEEPLLTGPVAKWDGLRDKWVSLLDAYTFDPNNDFYRDENRAYWWDGHENEVYTISTDCWRMPSNMLECQCDVYIGGSFVLMFADGRNATNIARWNAQTLQWEDLGGPKLSGINDVNKPVRSLWRFDANINIVQKALWVAGDFDGYLKKRMLRFSDQSWNDFYDINGPVYSLTYQFNILGRDFLIVGGDFNFTSTDNGGVVCTYLCVFNLFDEFAGWMPPTLDDAIYAPVTSVAMIDVNNYLFVSEGEPHVYISEKNRVYITESFEEPITSVVVCTNADLGCRRGSMSVLGKNNYMRFFDSARRTWHIIGNETITSDGVITQLEMVYQGAGSTLLNATTLLQSVIVMVLCIVFIL